ncbi:MAG: cell division control protein 6, partial [Methanocalculus sp. MSAO_Arc2]
RGVYTCLSPQEVRFPRYTADEIKEILAPRVKAAVRPGVVPQPVLDEIVRQTEKAGDLRVGLELLRRAVLSAERAGRSAVVIEDIGVFGGGGC